MHDHLDAIIVGYGETDLQAHMANLSSMGDYSGAYRNMTQNLLYVGGRWRHYMDFLNRILMDATGKPCSYHPMKMPNLGVCYLVSFLRRFRLNATYINFFNLEKEHFLCLLDQDPVAVVISTTYYVDTEPVERIIKFIRSHNLDTRIVIGGPLIYRICTWSGDSITRDYYLEKMGADFYIHDAQGERTLGRLLQELNKGLKANIEAIPNLFYRTTVYRSSTYPGRPSGKGAVAPKFAHTARVPEQNDLDRYSINWRLFPKELITPTAITRTARGCAFKCAFCSYPVLTGGLSLNSVKTIERQLTQLCDAGAENLVFIDDTFNVPLPRFKRILEMMIDNDFRFEWYSFFRCSHADDDTFDMMSQSGCRAVFLGLESGDQLLLNKMNKKSLIGQYETGIKRLKDYGIDTFASLVVGFPGETDETVANTIAFVERARPTYFKAELYYHSAAAPVAAKENHYGLKGAGFSWSHATMDWKQACDFVDKMYREVEGAAVLPLYLFDFWSIPYLRGKGLTSGQIKKFVELCRPLLLRNLGSPPHTPPVPAVVTNELQVFAKQIGRTSSGSE